MNVSRRRLLKAAPYVAAIPVLAAAGCTTLGTVTPTIAVSKISGYFQAAVNGLSAIVLSSAIQADLGASGTTTAKNALADAQNVLNDVTAAATTVASATAQGWAQEIQTDANAVLPLVSTIPGLPASVTTIITAVEVVLPILLAAVGSQLAASARAAAPTTMTIDQALAILKAPKV
jgi:hypothetical protein